MANTAPKRITVPAFRAMKGGPRIGTITAYDFPSAKIADSAGADMILVGDSLGMVVLGHHVRAVARGTSHALLVGDMPYLSYHISVEESVRNAGAFIRAGAQAVKVEGGRPSRIRHIRRILDAEIPVMGHIGLTPQSVNAFGGFKLQGKGSEDARRLIDEARALEKAGCFSIVLECVPAELAAFITDEISIPTIGIGAGPACDGQVLVFHDLLGLYDGHKAKFVRRYAEIGDAMRSAISGYLDDLRTGKFPDVATESFHVGSEEELRRLYGSQAPADAAVSRTDAE
jgi:3-methyl-2-oxobutanoate hydroxymethyltransferase